MVLNHKKELTPVLYDSSGVKILDFNNWDSNILICNMHWHERVEFMLVTSGTLHFRLNSFETLLTEGQLAIVTPHAQHYALTGQGGCSLKSLMFDVETFYNQLPITEHFFKPLVDQTVSFVPYTDHPDVIRVMKSIVEKSTDEDALAPLFRVGKIYELITLLYRHCLAERESEVLTQNQLQDVLDYINTHFCENISSADLAKKFGYSEGYFCRHFKVVTGLSPMIYIRILRLEKARELLQRGQHSFSEIASRCGFSSPTYFTRCFKSHFEMTPSEYLRQFNEKA